MTAYNRDFDLDLQEMELIETALHEKVRKLSEQRSQTPDAALDTEIDDVRRVLGRLHNQKVFYRPRKAYIGG